MLFEDFLKQAKITQANASFEPQDARIITPAVAPGLPSSPNRASFMGEAIILGLLGGLGGSFLKEKLRRGFVTPRELEGQIGLPVLASIQRLGNRDLRIGRKISRIYELPFSKPGDRYSESIRSLRSSLQIMVADDRPRVIQVTSATPGEGKTTISLSMAVSAAATLKVLLIDADLRRSSATHAFKLEQAPGLVDVLLGEIAVPDALQYSEQLKHWMLPAGKRITNSVDLLGSEKMKQLLLDLKRDFDLIIVDTPPSGLVIDPVVVSHICDKILYVVRWGTTPRELVKQSVNVLSSEHHKIGGITLNMVDEKKARKYGRNSDPYYYASRHHKNYYAR
jgi:capsular exopolysaccharide synthesis family protein